MTDALKIIKSTFTDHEKAHAELEGHRAKAIEHFGGHVHYAGGSTSSIPIHNDSGELTGYTFLMVSGWKNAAPEPTSQDTE